MDTLSVNDLVSTGELGMHATDAAANSHLVRVADVAKHLNLSRSKVYLMMETGELPFVKFGKSRRIRWPDVLTLVEKNMVGRV
jgi:excisionase family DNA binding protein